MLTTKKNKRNESDLDKRTPHGIWCEGVAQSMIGVTAV